MAAIAESLRYLYLRRLVMPGLRCCGPRFASWLAARLARGVYQANPPARARAEARILAAQRLALESFSTTGDRSDSDDRSAAGATISHTIDAAADLARESFEHFGRFWAESLFLARRLTEARWRNHVRIDDEPEFRRLAADRRGCILAMGWHGNIAAAALALGQVFRLLHVVADTRHAMVSRLWTDEFLRVPHVRVVDVLESARVVSGVLENGGAVLLIAEQEHPRGRGVPVTYLGRTFSARPTIGVLSCMFDAPVAVVTCRRGGAFKFDLNLHGVVDPREMVDPDGAADPRAIMHQTFAALETAIMKSPEQYAWSLSATDSDVFAATRSEQIVQTSEHDAPTSAAAPMRHVPAGA